jgi:hypothetical protein
MNISDRVFQFLMIFSFFIISCSNDFKIYDNPTKNSAVIANK